MKPDALQTWHLLKPHARPRLRFLLLVLVLGMITATAQTSVILLIRPVWNVVLFPEKPDEVEVLCPSCERSSKPGICENRIEDEDAQTATECGAVVPTVEEGGTHADFFARHFSSLGHWVTDRGLVEDFRVAVLVALTSLALALGLLGAVTQFSFVWLGRRVALLMIVDLRMRLARHLIGLSVRYHGERKFGDLLSRLSADVMSTLGAITVFLRSIVLELFFALTALAAAVVLAPLTMSCIFAVLLVALLPVRKMSARVRRGSRKSMTSLGASVQVLTQMFQGIRTVKAFGGEERELERYRHINHEYVRTSMKMVRAIAFAQSWTALYSVAGVAILLLVLGLAQIFFHLFGSAGEAVTLLLLVARFNNHIKNSTKGLTRVEEAVGASARIQEVLDETMDVREAEDPQPIHGIGTGIRFEGVGFTYPGADVPAIRDLHLEVRPGETLALVGPSGAGKSTLVDLLARFIDPTEGRITVDGRDLRGLVKDGWTAQYAMVGQSPFLFHASIAENIAYGKPGATAAEIEAAARVADIHDFIAGLAHGYDTDVADMGSRLSGGQRQRITIARAVLKGAPLLLLDEATSALDSESEAEVQAALDRLMADRTVVVIAHRLSTVQNADRIAVLEEGRLVELGTHEELVKRGGTYARLSSLQNLGTPVRP